MAKTYDPANVEDRRYAQWLEMGVFSDEPDPARPPFVISMPPPNITGRAHLGHASTYTTMDILVRYHRMLGENAVWLPGQDHAAIATEAVLVRELAKEGHTRESLGRDAYLARAWQWRERYGFMLYDQFRKLGFGPDWARDRFTLDPGLSAAVVKIFVALYRKGLIYRATRLVNWDPQARSTLSDAEVEEEERDGFLWRIRYPSADGNDAIEVATTRPETMLGDTAIAVHPEDARFAHLIGKEVVLPLVGRAIPIVADEAVEPDFGTGAVKVTPAHDPLDNQIGQRHGLAMPSVIGFDGAMTDEVPEPYRGLDRYAARDAVVRDLTASGALVSTTPYRHKVPVSSRSGAVVEPLLSLQWFCRMSDLAKPAKDAYERGDLRFVPERFGKTYAFWLDNIRDWNVSRQIWWGHRLPVWYSPGGEPVVAESEEEARAIARRDFGTDELTQDPDTLDTWFSSALWPFSILGWPADTPEREHWYPNQVLVTGREIIFLWVSRMVMLGCEFAGGIPFRDVFIAPLVFDDKGRKMSKSLGNVIDPIDLISTYGADATRLGTVRQMRLESQELRFDERYVEKAREFNNKMWNALRYVRSLPEGLPGPGVLPAPAALGLADRWILAQLRETIVRVSTALDRYEIGVAADAVMDFIWYRYCDWYIEATKTPNPTRATILSYVLNASMRLLHPIAPFVSEEIWQALPHDGKTIVTASWPDAEEIVADAPAAQRYELLQSVVAKAREFRAEMSLGAKTLMTLGVPPSLDPDARALLATHAHATLIDDPVLAATDGSDPLLAVTPQAPAALMRERYAKEATRLDSEVARFEKKLADERYTTRAAAAAVAKDREKLAAYRSERERVQNAMRSLGD